MSGEISTTRASPWRCPQYPRFTLTEDEAVRLVQRFVIEGQVLTREDMRHELLKAGAWLRDNPSRAKHKRAWYRFISNWMQRAEDAARDAQRRNGGRIAGRNPGRYYQGEDDEHERRRALGLE